MQKKSNFLTKLVKKDYNNRLEEVLSKKDFKEEVKNTLLSMFYKVENGYKDYKTVKRETFEKKEYIEKLINIIEKDCDKISFINQNNKQKELVNKEEKEIICLPIENKILYGLAKIQKRNIVVKYVDEDIAKAFSTMLNTGNNINIVEPLRDFNGFSWNIIEKDIEDLNYNLIYQNMLYLMGNEFLDKWVNTYEPLVDYFDLFQSEIQKKYGSKLKTSIITYMIRISLKLNSIYDEDFKAKIIKKEKDLEQEIKKLENNEDYLVDISKNKKKKEKQIKQIDKIINDKNLLIEEYENRNKKLPLDKKIFSIRVLKNNLKKEREDLLKEINEINKIINPKNFIEMKKKTEDKYQYFKDIENMNLKNEIINLQKEIITCMYIDIKNIKDKQNIIEFIYKFRYYNLLPIENKKQIFKEIKLQKSLDKLLQTLVDKAIYMKTIIKISENPEENYKLSQNIILSKIISLEDINIKIKNDKEKAYLIIFDEQIEDEKIELQDLQNIKIKSNKKTKLFI